MDARAYYRKLLATAWCRLFLLHDRIHGRWGIDTVPEATIRAVVPLPPNKQRDLDMSLLPLLSCRCLRAFDHEYQVPTTRLLVRRLHHIWIGRALGVPGDNDARGLRKKTDGDADGAGDDALDPLDVVGVVKRELEGASVEEILWDRNSDRDDGAENGADEAVENGGDEAVAEDSAEKAVGQADAQAGGRRGLGRK